MWRFINLALAIVGVLAVVACGNEPQPAPTPPPAVSSTVVIADDTPTVDEATKKLWREDEEKLARAGFKVILDSTRFENVIRIVKVDLGCPPDREFYIAKFSPLALRPYYVYGEDKYEGADFTTQPTAEQIKESELCK